MSLARSKADTSALRSGLAGKADTSAVRASLAAKLDTNGVAANSKLLLGKDTTALWNAKTLQGKDTLEVKTFVLTGKAATAGTADSAGGHDQWHDAGLAHGGGRYD